MSAIDNFFLQQVEPDQSCFLYLRQLILNSSNNFTEHFKYGLPFFYYKQKPCCYLWKHKKHGKPYISFVDGNYMKDSTLLQENRARMKIYLVDPEQDISVKKIKALLQEAMLLSENKKSKISRRNRLGIHNSA